MITVSIVSHGHGALLAPLLADLTDCPEIDAVVLTRNLPDRSDKTSAGGGVIIIENAKPKGFAANHNAAFQHHARTPYLAVVNPDIRLCGNPFPALLRCIADTGAALCAPAVKDPAGRLEDSARYFPSIGGLLLKALGCGDGRVPVARDAGPMVVPWVAGMFMLFPYGQFEFAGGFDEQFFLYYEDVDLCARLHRAGRDVRWCPSVEVIHDARRASRRNPRHMVFHATSLMRYLWKHAGRLPQR